MATNRTFTMIKPDAVEANNIGSILAMMTEAGFRIVAMKYTKLSEEQAGKFYETPHGRGGLPGGKHGCRTGKCQRVCLSGQAASCH